MKNTQNIASLIARLEYEIGIECYNPNSYDGYTGIEGCGYRYPVKVYQNENMRTYCRMISEISPSEIHTMKYVYTLSLHDALQIGRASCRERV